MEDINSIEAEIKRLQEKLAMAKAEPALVIVKKIEADIVTLSGTYREDIVNAERTIPSRKWDSWTKTNTINVKDWPELLRKLESLPNLVIEYADNTYDVLNKPVVVEPEVVKEPEPDWTVEIRDRFFLVKLGPDNKNTNFIWRFTNNEPIFNVQSKGWEIPLSEGYRLFKEMEPIFTKWTDEAKEFVLKQLEQRARLDTIAVQDISEDVINRMIANGGKAEEMTKLLRPFQSVGIDFCDAADGRAIIADEMGLGKTWQTIGFALLRNTRKNLVICPASLKNNWTREIKKLTGEAPYLLFGRDPSVYDMATLLAKDCPKWVLVNYDILGTRKEYRNDRVDDLGRKTEELIIEMPWIKLINGAKFDCVIIDEGHYIKNVESYRSQAVRQVKARHILFATGTPVLNRPGELWPMLNVIDPKTFPAHDTFLKQYTYDGKTAKNVEQLRRVLAGIMIRRLKKDVVKDLPPINRINEYHELSERAKGIYNKVLMGVWKALDEYNNKGSAEITSILTQIMRLKQVCAIDKVDRTAEMAMQVYDSSEGEDHRKVLIFTQFKGVAVAIAQRLGGECLSFVERRGTEFVTLNNSERDSLVQQFQTDPNIHYLVVTEKTAKEGHNITAAGTVIFNDLFWTPASHEQGEGRAYGRMSDSHSITSYYIITDMNGNSIEEWVWELLAMKFKVIQEVVEGIDNDRDSSMAMDIIQKFKDSMWMRGT